jgi:hypothetical protein
VPGLFTSTIPAIVIPRNTSRDANRVPINVVGDGILTLALKILF